MDLSLIDPVQNWIPVNEGTLAIMQYSYQIVTNKHLFNYVIPIYEHLMAKLIEKPSITPLLVFKHLVYNNISKVLSSGGNYIVLEILLCQLANAF